MSAPFAPDEALPGRDVYLDPDAAARRLAAALTAEHDREVDVRPLGRVRAKYRIGESLRVVHRVVIDGRAATATARVFRSGGAERTAARARSEHPDHAAHDERYDAVWWVFPADRKLARAREVVAAAPALASELGITGWRSTSVAEYAPERSLTVRASALDATITADAMAYVKLYAPGTVDSELLEHRYAAAVERFAGVRLPGGLRVRIPSVTGRSDDRTVLALEPVPGRPWRGLDVAALPTVFAHLGAAVAWFHGVDPAGLAAPFGRLRADRVTHSAELVARARPELLDRLDGVAARLADAPDPDERPVLLHGDCHPKNTLVDATGRPALSLIDLDQAGAGPAAADVASLLARLDHGVLLGEHDRATADRLAGAFLGGYATVSALPGADELRWHHVAALLAERAIRAVNRVNLAALACLPGLVDLAAHRLDHPVPLPPASRPARATTATPRPTGASGVRPLPTHDRAPARPPVVHLGTAGDRSNRSSR